MKNQEMQEKFVAHIKRRYGERSTAKHYESDLKIFQTVITDKAWEDIWPQDIESFVTKQHQDGKSATTINRRLATLRTFFEWLAGEEGMEKQVNPVIWRRHKMKEGKLLPRDASDEQVERLFGVIESPRDRAIFSLMVGGGLRVAEVAVLGLDAVSPPATPGEMARLRIKGKGEQERMGWMTPKVYTTVAEWLQVRPATSQDEHLFLNQHGAGLSTSGIQYLLAGYCEQAGIDISCHQLRHTFARRLAEERMPVEAIADVMGHSQIETTQRYINGANPDLRDQFQAVMTRLENRNLPPTPALPLPALSATPAPSEQADSAQLLVAQTRFAELPDWLRPTLVDYLALRWRSWKAHMAAEHAHRLSRHLAHIWGWLVEKRSIDSWASLQRRDVELWMSARQTDGLALSSLRTLLSNLFGFFHFALDQGLPLHAALLRIPYPELAKPLPRTLSEVDYLCLVETVLAKTSDSSFASLQGRAWFLTLAHTGLRINELLNLRLSDLDLTGQRLFVRDPKNHHERVVFMTPSLVQTLATYLVQRPASSDDHLWLRKGLPLTAHYVRHRLRLWGDLAQVTVSPHRLRHTFATRLLNQGMPILSISKLLGHDSLHATQRYAHLYDETVRRHFQAAVAHIEGIPVSNWPASTTHSVTLLVDSV